MTYTAASQNPTGTSYFQGIIKPWNDYCLFSKDNNTSILVTGLCIGDDGRHQNYEDAIVYTLTRNNNTSPYTVTSSSYDEVTINYQYPYYMYSNSSSMMPALNCTVSNSIQSYCVIFCCIIFVIDIVIGNVIKLLARRIGR